MSDIILIDGDQVTFIAAFGLASVIVQPGKLVASGPATIGGKKVCVEGDEASVEVQPCQYTTLVHSTPGFGKLKIKALKSDQIAKKTRSGGKPVLLKGVQFDAVFEVVIKAMQPVPGSAPKPDDTTEYAGYGSFIPTNLKFMGA